MDYLAILRRRKWIIITVPVIAALFAFQYSSSQPSVYQARAQVLVQRSAGIAGVQDPPAYDPIRYLTTQAQIAREPKLAARVAAAEGVPRITAGEILADSNVSPDAEADLLNISFSSGNPRDAVALANAYAHEFTRYKTELDTARIDETLQAVKKAQAALLRKSGGTASTAYQTLVQRQAELEVAKLAVASNTRVLAQATGAAKIQPRPRRAFILAELLGAIFALGLVFLAEALDRRVRTEGEIEELLGLPLLGRISRPPPSLRKENELVMLAQPMGVHAEAFRKLWGTMEFVAMQRGAASRTIMFTSATQREGKSTTVANLAIALARSGRRVALVDLDLRRPSLHTFFGVRAEPGFTDVVVGGEALDRSARHLALPTVGGLESPGERNGQPSAPSGKPNAPLDLETILDLLPCGTIPPAAGEFLADKRVFSLLGELGERFDVVLVDAPPITVVGDAMTLSAAVDAIVVVTSASVERPVVHDLAHELQNCRATTLGLVLTGVPLRDPYMYGYRSYDDGQAHPATRRDRQPLVGALLRKARAAERAWLRLRDEDAATRRGRQPLFGALRRKARTAERAWLRPRGEGAGSADADTGPREDVTQADDRA